MAWSAAAALFLGAGLCASGAAVAQARHAFDIPAGPAAQAIGEFARQADLNVLAAGELLGGRRTQAVRCACTAAEGLERLLAGSGLAARTGPGGTVFLDAAPPAPAPPFELPAAVLRVIVSGARAAQQSAIVDKRFAPAAMDVVVAEDVGTFPDRNAAEAISRVAGVALDRGDYGEGISVGLRGVGADMTRVEIDGLGVAGAGGAGLLGPDDRSVELRELPTDAIRSIEVVKGATAADTEGGLAGSIRIRTRTGLDFKGRYLSGRVSGTRNSIDGRWGPDLSFVYADRFLDGRLGIVATAAKSHTYNEHHRQELSVNGGSGPSLLWDFDGAPQKTFTFNPATLSASDPAVDARLSTSPFALTPRELVTRSAAAATKADCYAALPPLNTAQLATVAQSRRAAAASQRAMELATCLNQWNDYTPTLVRSAIKRQDDARTSGDLRVDFKVNERLAVFAKGTRQTRTVWDTWMTHSLGNMSGAASAVTPSYRGPTYVDDAGVRSAVAASGYHVVPGVSAGEGGVVAGVATNVDPASVVVDASHHVTRATIADGTVGTEKQLDRIDTRNSYLQLGGTYRDGRFKGEWMAGRVTSAFQREARRMGLSYAIGPVTMQRLDNGMWTYALPPGVADGFADPASYAGVAAPANASAQQPLVGDGFGVSYTPTAGSTRETTVQADTAYSLAGLVPVATRLRFGVQRRRYDNRYWNGQGYQVSGASGVAGQPDYVAPVIVPSPRLRDSGVYPCQDTAGSLGPGGLPCAYGYTPSTGLASARDGRVAVTPQQFGAIVGQVMNRRTAPFFDGARDRPAGLVDGWYDIDVLRAFALAGIRNDDARCLQACTGSDGNVYPQPVNALAEQVDAAYAMTEFSSGDWLPLGIRIDGNAGVRAVRTRVRGTGLLTVNAVTKTAAFDPARPTLAQGVATTSVTTLTSLDRHYTDFLPSFNAAAWLVPERLVLRYGDAKMIGRPKVSQMVPNGTCTYDERLAGTGEAMQCSGTLGNPALKPWSSRNRQLGLEYYPDADTLFSIAHFRHHGLRGAPRTVVLTDQQLFAGSALADPATGTPLAGYRFSVPTFVNGEGVSRTGWEAAVKTALPFLPGPLRHLGVDANVAMSRPRDNGAQYRDLNSGDVLPPLLEPRRTVNVSLWYDDGTFAARVALQAVGERLYCIAPCGTTSGARNYPADGAGRVLLPYAPGLPVFGRETRYVDAHAAWRVARGVELFADVRNLGKTLLRTDTGRYALHADGSSNLLGIGYGGVRLSVGLAFHHGAVRDR